jgi:hypothetical protein
MRFADDVLTILDHRMPVWDAQRTERRILPVPVTQAYEAGIRTDFLDAVRDSRVARALVAMRSAMERAVAFLRRRPFVEPPPPARLRLLDLPDTGSWVKLGEDRPREYAFGAAGRFWAGETRWVEMGADQFSTFSSPGFARIGCHLRFTSLGPGRTEVAYVARTRTNDPRSREAFLNYWMLVAPFVGFIMRMTLRAIERDARRRTAGREVPLATPTPHRSFMGR